MWSYKRKTNLVFNGLTQMSLFTLSTRPATDASIPDFSPSQYVPWPLLKYYNMFSLAAMNGKSTGYGYIQ